MYEATCELCGFTAQDEQSAVAVHTALQHFGKEHVIGTPKPADWAKAVYCIRVGSLVEEDQPDF